MSKPINDHRVNAALSEVRDRLLKFYYSERRYDRFSVVSKIMDTVEEAARTDFDRQGQIEISRVEPIYIGEADNLRPQAFENAKVFLVDAATTRGWHKIPRFTIHAKAFRPYIPAINGQKEKGYFSKIQGSLDVEENEKKDPETVKKILECKMGDNGMYENTSQEYTLRSPKICLVYCNVVGPDRVIFMLRPSSSKLNRISYRAYCYVVMSSMIKRIEGSDCDMGFWDNLDDEFKMSYSQSMIVQDSMLVTKPDEVKRFPLIHKMLDMKRFGITSSIMFPESAVA